MYNAAEIRAEYKDLAIRCWRSPSEYAREFFGAWFPSKMPWVHRGIAALRTQQCDFLLDFGEEWWPEDVENGTPSEWTVDDVVKIVTNFVVVEREAKLDEMGRVVEPEILRPLFILDLDEQGVIQGIRIADEADGSQNAFMLPRGYSKTTLINLLNHRDLTYEEEKFILYVSETLPHASAQLLTLRGQFENNERHREVFGNQVPDRSASEKWGEKEFELLNGCRCAALGSGGQVRGISKDAVRPSQITVDDFQNEEGVKSDTQRAKDISWVLRTLLPARKLFGKNQTKINFIGTLLGPGAVMDVLLKDPDWTRVRFGARDRQGELLWAYALNEAKLEKLKAQFERLGDIVGFDYEYNSKLPPDTGHGFALGKITYLIRPSEWFEAKALVADPAISKTGNPDFFALACVGIGKFGDMHVIDFFGQQGVDFDDQAEKFFDMHFAHMLDVAPDKWAHGVESIAYQQALADLIKMKQAEKARNGWGERAFFPIEPITHGRTGKHMRIQGLFQPRVRSGHISMNQPFGVLIQQMRDYLQPGTKDDGPDAVAMAIGLLEPHAHTLLNVANENGDPVSALDAARSGTLFGGRAYRKAP